MDVSQIQYILEKAQGYGYRHVGFILDRGYFPKENIGCMDSCGYDFVIMVKGMNSLVREFILEERYVHLYYPEQKACAGKEQIESRIERMAKCLEQWKGQARSIADGFKTYFDLEVYEPDGTFLFAGENKKAIREGKRLCGYFVIVNSERMSANESIELYKRGDASEKLFMGDKAYLGIRV